VLKLTTDGSSEGHFDRVMAVMLCAEELMTRPAGSWLTAYSTVRCDDCGNAYPDRHAACPVCHPHESGSRADAPELAREPEPVTHGGWMSAYGAVRCENGHAYIAARHKQCPRCGPGAGRSGLSLPSMRGIGGMR
jgi:RNA polymerase subunit RPABC4/transcription elongation factor Spt4